ncbi:MAG: polymer-forming cytoskeletal protein [Elusimicrobia bacterium]|nr:polymer-forming cytoskeletal protein [Elusimicrobiota bacterium]MBU2615302.1 polymer-forming cytoskeletal protein [Elusimicrobiota bacterium]
MFGKKKETSDSLETIVGPETIFQGTIKSKGSIRIDGKIEGGILEASSVIIGASGQIQGDVNAKNVIVGGKVTGNITSTQNLEIQSKAQVFGDIHTALLSISEGALFEGHCVMAAEQNKVIEMDIPVRR